MAQGLVEIRPRVSQGLGKVSLGSILSRTTLDRTWGGLYEVITECQFTKISSRGRISQISLFGDETGDRAVRSDLHVDDSV